MHKIDCKNCMYEVSYTNEDEKMVEQVLVMKNYTKQSWYITCPHCGNKIMTRSKIFKNEEL